MGGALCKRPNDLARAVQRRRYIIGRRSSIDGDRERVDYLTVDSPGPPPIISVNSSPENFRTGIYRGSHDDGKKGGGGKKTGVWGYCIGRINDGLPTGRWVINIGEYMCFNRFQVLVISLYVH